jgi:hypothetical protein
LLFFGLSLFTKSTTVAFGVPLLFSYHLFKRKMSVKKFIILFISPFIILSSAAAIRTVLWFNAYEIASNLGFLEKFNTSQNLNDFKKINLPEGDMHLNPGEVSFFNLSPFDKSLLASKVFLRYVIFLILPLGGRHLFQASTNLTFSSLEFLMIFTGLCTFYFLIQYLIKKKLHIELFGLIFFISSLLPFCGFFYIPIFPVSNFVPYWLSIPCLGLLPLISHFIKSKRILTIIVIVFAIITHSQSYIFIKVEDIFIESIKQNPEKKIFTISLIEFYVFTHQCKKAKDLYQYFQENESTLIYCLDKKTKTCQDVEGNLK